jgi:hypothetical protein
MAGPLSDLRSIIDSAAVAVVAPMVDLELTPKALR